MLDDEVSNHKGDKQRDDECDDLILNDTAGSDRISKEILEYINLEYKNFTTSKTALIKLAKDFNKKLLRQIDEIQLPTLEDYLSTKYSVSSDKYICEYCNFIGKNQQSKSAHLRGCVEKKRIETQKPEKKITLTVNTKTSGAKKTKRIGKLP